MIPLSFWTEFACIGRYAKYVKILDNCGHSGLSNSGESCFKRARSFGGWTSWISGFLELETICEIMWNIVSIWFWWFGNVWYVYVYLVWVWPTEWVWVRSSTRISQSDISEQICWVMPLSRLCFWLTSVDTINLQDFRSVLICSQKKTVLQFLWRKRCSCLTLQNFVLAAVKEEFAM